MDIANSYVVDESCMANQLTYTKEGWSEVHHVKHDVYTLSEIKRWMERYGMREMAVCSSTELQPYQLGDQQTAIW